MRVLCCWTRLHPQTAAWLCASGADVLEFARLTAGDDYAYWGALAWRWGKGEDLLIVEHDVSGSPPQVGGFADCSHDWCASPYDSMPVNAYGGLGCTRFSARAQAMIPAASFRAPWYDLADTLTAQVRPHFAVHPHPPVTHHHGGPTLPPPGRPG